MAWVQVLQGLAREVIGHRLRAVTGSHARSSLQDFETPPGDPGLFGPHAVAWRVHAHFNAMMVGGLSSLMVQALHPRALAAVWDHSNFRHDLKGRLGRTAYFVAATTYGGTEMATRAIARVNAVHARAVGTDLTGQPYAANAPDLIRWVHLVEVSSFLVAYQHLSLTPLSPAECDTYIAEMTEVGHRLGALDLPRTWRETQDALAGFHDLLVFDARARTILEVIEGYPSDLLDWPFMQLVIRSAFDITPDWALARMGRTPSCEAHKQLARRVLQLASGPVQWMLDQQGVAATARARVQAGALA